jgi:hypothetical protein
MLSDPCEPTRVVLYAARYSAVNPALTSPASPFTIYATDPAYIRARRLWLRHRTSYVKRQGTRCLVGDNAPKSCTVELLILVKNMLKASAFVMVYHGVDGL